MTSEEIIEVFEEIIKKYERREVFLYPRDKFIETIQTAITMLKAQPCEDAISRIAALDALRTNWANWAEYDDGYLAMKLTIDDIQGLPAALPPVTPKITECEDAVSREAALSALSELPHEYKTKEQRARTGGIAACQVIISELPRVTPKPLDSVLDKIRAEIEPKCDRINSLASVLPYTAHREIQELLCEIMDLCKAESEDKEGENE